MTSEQREAAIERAAHRMWDDDHRRPGFVPAIPPDERDETAMECYRDYARATLDALTEEFVVLHRDDVTEEDRFRQIIKGGWGQGVPTHERRLVTRWEPITTKEENDA